MILKELWNGQVVSLKDTPVFEKEYDLIVVGLGAAGAVALISAGRAGQRVLGIEQHHGMGGIGTTGGINWYYFGALGGLYTEIDDKAIALENHLFAPKSRMYSKEYVLEREAALAGAEIKYHTYVTGVYMEGSDICGIRYFSNGVTSYVKAKTFIDATGEAILCNMAGCETYQGRESDGQTQPFTFTSVCVNAQGSSGGLNMDSGFIRQEKPLEVSEAFVRANNFPMYLKGDYRQDERKFVSIAPLIGVREGRRIRGRKQLTFSDVAHQKHTVEKPLFYAFSNIDNHGKDIAMEDTMLCDWMVAAGLWGVLISIPVELEHLRPIGVDNLLAAGRHIAIDHNLAAGIRMMRDMAKCGEAAAAICAEANRSGKSFDAIDYENVAEALRKTGCLDEANNVGFRERVANQYLGNPLPSLHTVEEIIEWLKSDKPGWGMWSAKLLAQTDDTVICKLKKAFDSEDENLKRNIALTFGLLGERCAAEKLRQIAKEQDNYVPASSLKYVYTRGVSAVYLLGRLGDRDSVTLLLDIIKKRGSSMLDGFVYGEFYANPEDVATQYVMFAVRALMDIGHKHPLLMGDILVNVLAVLEQEDYRLLTSFKDNKLSLHDLKPKLIEYVKKYQKIQPYSKKVADF